MLKHPQANYSWKTKSVLVDQGAGKAYSPRHTLYCAEPECNESLSITGPSNMPPDVIRYKFSQQGWLCDTYNARKCRCPKHAMRRTNSGPASKPFNPAIDLPTERVERLFPREVAKQNAEKLFSRPETPKEEVVQPTPTKPVQQPVPQTTVTAFTPPVTSPTPKQVRQMTALLERHFDDKRGIYRGGYSDARVAQEVEIEPRAVWRFREDAFGPLKVNPRLEGLRAEFTKLAGELEALRLLFEETEKKLAAEESLLNLSEAQERKAS